MSKGKIIVFEGGEGSGKSTQIKKLKSWLVSNDKKVKIVREPGSVELGEEIRKILLDSKHDPTDLAEFFLFLASRSQIVDKVKKWQKKGYYIIYDRFYPSTYVYQAYAGNLDLNLVKKVDKVARKGLKPDLVLILDVDPKEGLRRVEENRMFKTRIDSKDFSFHEQVRKGYLKYAKQFGWKIVNGDKNIEEVHQKVKLLVKDL